MISTSEKIDTLLVALGKFQAALEPITKDASNPHLRNRYASLTHIMKEIQPLLTGNGLVVTQGTVGLGGEIGVTTRVAHAESAQWQESTILIPIGDVAKGRNLAQEVGSSLTYLRRYSLAAALGITVDEDDDGGPAPKGGTTTTKKKSATKKPAGNGKSAYWDALGPKERAAYRSWDNVLGAIGELERYKGNQFGIYGAIRKLFPKLEENGPPAEASEGDGKARVEIYRTVKAYAQLRDNGKSGDEAQGAAFGLVKNLAHS